MGRLGEGTLAPGMFRRFEGFGGVKAANVSNTDKKIRLNRFSIHGSAVPF